MIELQGRLLGLKKRLLHVSPNSELKRLFAEVESWEEPNPKNYTEESDPEEIHRKALEDTELVRTHIENTLGQALAGLMAGLER